MNDIPRRIVRSLIPRGFYSKLAAMLNSMSVLTKQGWTAFQILCLKKGAPGEIIQIKLRGIKHPIHLRAATPDTHALIQNLVRKEFGNFSSPERPATILDAGGYIGDTAVYFLNRFPDAKVVVLEPDNANLEVARKNLSPYGERSSLVPKGLWHQQEELFFDSQFVSTAIGDKGEHSVQCTTVCDVLADFGLDGFDIIKMDIEGAERQVFELGELGWLEHAKLLIIEFHGDDIQNICTNALAQHGFSGRRYRSLYYFTRQSAH